MNEGHVKKGWMGDRGMMEVEQADGGQCVGGEMTH